MDRLERLAPEGKRLGYLAADDGFWAALVVSEATFLEDLGYDLTNVSFHQEGDVVTYSGPRGTVTFEFVPDANWIGGSASLHGNLIRFDGDLDLLALLKRPTIKPPEKYPLTRENIDRVVRHWLTALREAREML